MRSRKRTGNCCPCYVRPRAEHTMTDSRECGMRLDEVLLPSSSKRKRHFEYVKGGWKALETFEACTALVNCEGNETVAELSRSNDSSPPRPRLKTKRFAGAAKYKTKFNCAWKKEFPFIMSVPGDPFR